MSQAALPSHFETNPEHKARLLAILKEKSYVEGEVVLASGKKSDFYVDCRQTSLDAEGAYLIGQIFHRWLEQLPEHPVAVGGMTMGADPLVTATSVTSFLESNPVNAFLLRKEPKGHGMQSQIEGTKSVEAGDQVVLLEDVVTTGGSTLKALDVCGAANLDVVAVFCLVDRQEGGRAAVEQHGAPLFSIFTRKDVKGE